RYYNGSSWSDQIYISTKVNMHRNEQSYVSSAIDSQDNIHVVWQGEGGDTEAKTQIWYALNNGSWSTPLRISNRTGMDTVENQLEPAIAIDGNDTVHVVWAGVASGQSFPTQLIYYSN
ncbi:unnamed protein product, partial [marine sediment metagenome]